MTDKHTPFFITTAISYPNGNPHIGHAYEAIATDVIARFKRLDGADVKFLTGTDDHGQKMFQTAREKGISARELADEVTPRFREMVAAFNCSHDDFIRTSEARHHKAVDHIWRQMDLNGDIYKDNYAGWYCMRDEAFFTEDELIKNADGAKTTPRGAPVEWVEEDSYFFKLSAYQDKLLAYFEAHPDFIQPSSRRNEIMAFVKTGLKDISISRTSFDWGVPVPNDPAHVVYVWVDALTNYLTALGYPDDMGDMGDFWPASLHIIGKDITRFHAVYWPAFLLSAGLPLPKKIFAHGFLTMRGEKMSKSLGNGADPFEMIAHYGAENLRYYFMREVSFGQDGGFSDEAIINRVNADLANDLGNLAQRSLSMIAKNGAGKLVAPDAFLAADTALLAQADGLYGQISSAMQGLGIHNYIAAVMDVVSATNRYFAEQEPWVLQKTDPQRMAVVLYVTAEIVRQAAIALQPVVPVGAGKLLDYLKVEAKARDFTALGAAGRLTTRDLPAPSGVFPRLVAEAPEKPEKPEA